MFVLTSYVRRAIITEKVTIYLTLLGPLPPPYFLLSKAEASCSLTPLQSWRILHSERSSSFETMPYNMVAYHTDCFIAFLSH